MPGDLSVKALRALADPSHDLDAPIRGPFAPVRGEGAELARAGLQLAKRAHLLPAVLLVPAGDASGALSADEVLKLEQVGMEDVAAARVPLADVGDARVHVFRPKDGGEDHYAIEVGSPHRDRPVLARVHSACFTGDILGSLRCDCGGQLQMAMDSKIGRAHV